VITCVARISFPCRLSYIYWRVLVDASIMQSIIPDRMRNPAVLYTISVTCIFDSGSVSPGCRLVRKERSLQHACIQMALYYMGNGRRSFLASMNNDATTMEIPTRRQISLRQRSSRLIIGRNGWFAIFDCIVHPLNNLPYERRCYIK
jgi:hypothetical protein